MPAGVRELRRAGPPFSPGGVQDVESTRDTYFAGEAAMILWSPFLLDAMAGLNDEAVPSCPQCRDDPAYLAKHSGLIGPLGVAGHAARAVRHDHHLGHRPRRDPGGAAARPVHALGRVPALAGDLPAGQVPGPGRRCRGLRPLRRRRRLGRARERRRPARPAEPVLLRRVDRLARRRRAQLPALGLPAGPGRAGRRDERPPAGHRGAGGGDPRRHHAGPSGREAQSAVEQLQESIR